MWDRSKDKKEDVTVILPKVFHWFGIVQQNFIIVCTNVLHNLITNEIICSSVSGLQPWSPIFRFAYFELLFFQNGNFSHFQSLL